MDSNTSSTGTLKTVLFMGGALAAGWFAYGIFADPNPAEVQASPSAPKVVSGNVAPAAPQSTPVASITGIAAASRLCDTEDDKSRRGRLSRALTFVPRLVTKPFRGGEEEAPAEAPANSFASPEDVIVCVAADADGIVRHLHPVEGAPDLALIAMDALRGWRYQPTAKLKRGQLAWAQVTLRVASPQ